MQLTKNIKTCYSWAGSAANRLTLKTMNPSITFSLDFQTKEAENTVGTLLKKIHFNQGMCTTQTCGRCGVDMWIEPGLFLYVEDEVIKPSAKQNIVATYSKKRKAVTQASKPPTQKNRSSAFTPMNNFEDFDESPKPKSKVRDLKGFKTYRFANRIEHHL
jgi:hypothetical protein